MTIHVLTHENFLRQALEVAVLNVSEDGTRQILRLGDPGEAWETVDPASCVEVPPTLRLPLHIGREVLDALARHHQGAEDTRQLRADYNAALGREQRKDELIGDVLRTLAGVEGRRG